MMKRYALLALIAILPLLLLAQHCGHCSEGTSQPNAIQASSKTTYTNLPGYDKKVWIGSDNYFTYEFDKKPKMGNSVLVVKLFDKAGKAVTDWIITGAADMPSMRGAHSSGDVTLKTNKKGNYLLPVNFVMPGEWEITLNFNKGGKALYHGLFTLKI
jgi:hypothetical protein